jgi:hypothetical protein
LSVRAGREAADREADAAREVPEPTTVAADAGAVPRPTANATPPMATAAAMTRTMLSHPPPEPFRVATGRAGGGVVVAHGSGGAGVKGSGSAGLTGVGSVGRIGSKVTGLLLVIRSAGR